MRSNRLHLRVAAALTAVTCLTACGSSSSDSGNTGGKLPSTITIPSIVDLTGASAFSGGLAKNGAQLAADEINSKHFLGPNTKLVIDTKDAASDIQTAASEFTAATADKKIPAVLGPITSGESQAVGPIAMKSRTPVVFTQSGSPGTVLGAYTFRLTAPFSSYYESVLKPFIAAKNIKTASVVYSTINPTMTQLGKETVPNMAKSLGFTVTSTTGVQANAVDFSATVSKIISEKAQLVFLEILGPQFATIIPQLRRAGYKGEIAALSSACCGNLKSVGADAAGMVWPVDFFHTQTGASSEAFTAAYKAKFNDDPSFYAAERYDAVWFVARALKQAGTTDRAAVQKAMDVVADKGFDGALGTLKFDNRDLRVPGVLVEWDGKAEKLSEYK